MSSTQQNEIQAEFITTKPADKNDVSAIMKELTSFKTDANAEISRIDGRVTALGNDLKPVMVTSLHMAGRHEEGYALAGVKREEGLKGYWQDAKTWGVTPVTPKSAAIDALKAGGVVVAYELLLKALDASLPKPGLVDFVTGFFSSGKRR